MARILVVGEGGWSSAVSSRLEHAGYAVVLAGNAMSAAEIAIGSPPGAIVFQAGLRGASGTQLCRLLRAELRVGEIPVIIVSPDPLGPAFEARAAGAHHVRDLDALLLVLPSIMARPNLPPPVAPADRESLLSRLPSVLDRALCEGEIAAEVRALASVVGREAMFEGLVALASQIFPHAWLALVVCGEEPGFLLQAGSDPEIAEREARDALELSESAPCIRSSRVAPPQPSERVAIEVPIFFGDSQVGQLAIALPIGHDRLSRKRVDLVAYELGGPIKIMSLLEEVERKAGTDALTGIMNRRAFFETLAREQARSARHHYSISVLVLDIDHFKAVNDVHGHAGGDLVLRGVSRVLTGVMRRGDIVCRWGGEEFVVALPQTERAGALLVAERIRERIERTDHHLPDGNVIKVTVSIGVASAGPPWVTDKLVAEADAALYDAKRSGRNRVCVTGRSGRVDG